MVLAGAVSAGTSPGGDLLFPGMANLLREQRNQGFYQESYMETLSSNLELTTSFKGGLISLGLSAGLQLSTHEFPAPSLSLP